MDSLKKYPRTPHLPWSLGATEDDERGFDVSVFAGREVVVTEKMDGECTTIYRDGCYARSLSTGSHPSRDQVRSMAAAFRYRLEPDERVVGENVFARHSIHYTALSSYFLVHGWYFDDQFESWRSTAALAVHFGLSTVPVLYRGLWDEAKVRACFTGHSRCGGEQEGYVVRLASDFAFSDFGHSVAKFVRGGHVKTDEHWLNSTPVRNELLKVRF